MNHSALATVAIDAIDRAAELIRTRLPGMVIEKQERDLVSEVDVLVERAVRKHLADATPNIGFLGEEEGVSGDASGLLWALDPVDGTANFVRGLPLCATSLGLIEHGRPVVGVIELPFLNVRYCAVSGGGAYRGDTRIRCGTPDDLSHAIVSIGDYAVGADAGHRNKPRLTLTRALASRAQRIRMFGSAAIDLAWVADGKTDASVMLSNKPWDTAAGVVIAREAGAVVIDIDGSDHTSDATATIAASPGIIDDIRALISTIYE